MSKKVNFLLQEISLDIDYDFKFYKSKETKIKKFFNKESSFKYIDEHLIYYII